MKLEHFGNKSFLSKILCQEVNFGKTVSGPFVAAYLGCTRTKVGTCKPFGTTNILTDSKLSQKVEVGEPRVSTNAIIIGFASGVEIIFTKNI